MPTLLIGTADGAMAASLGAMAEGFGWDVAEAEDGVDLLSLAASRLPQVVFLDPALPVFDGLDASTRLRQDPDIPKETAVYLVTPNEIPPHQREAAGLTGIIPPTLGAAELQELLAKHFA